MSTFRYLLDTNVLIDARKRRPSVARRFVTLEPGEAAQSVITFGELLHGASKGNQQAEARRRLEELALLVPVLPLTSDIARTYGPLRTTLETRGEVIGANDLWIAAHALSSGLILVTNNEREFSRVPGLMMENWAEPEAR